MTDVNTPVSAPVFSDHSHYPIGHAPVAASVLTPIPATERGSKTATVEVAEIAEPTGIEPAAETGKEPAKDVADHKGANGDAVDGKSSVLEEPLLAAQPVAVPVATPAAASNPSSAAVEAAVPVLPVLVAAKDDVPKEALTSTGDAASATTTASATPATAEAVVGDKRKADTEEQQAENGVDLPVTEAGTTDENGESAAKKAKKAKTEATTETTTETKAEDAKAAPAVDSSATNGVDAKKSNGRAKREKKPVPVVGRTARKTRSQGPVDA